MPLDSAFTGMEATLAGEHRVAQIVPRSEAMQDYDEAITDGHAAVLLECLEPGMLCVNLGNLKPGEEGEIVLRFAVSLGCAGGVARFCLPLVHRPRYGRSRLEELVEPRHDFAVEHPLEAMIRVRGLLSHAPVGCATHAARFSTDGDGQTLRLNQAMLDRDLVLVFDLPADFAGQARVVRDADAAIGVLSFNLPASTHQTARCDLCLVMDGSGSMAGDAMAQSRAALSAVAGALGDEDRIQVLRFGSTTLPLFRRPLKASERVRSAMVELSDTLDASLGGTKIGAALDHAIDALTGLRASSGRSQAIILVTDGAVQPGEVEAPRMRAQAQGIRVFVVAVGSSAGSAVLLPLASATGAVLERVPAEPIDEAVSRQLQRARQTAPAGVEIDWGDPDAKPLPLGPAYAGDAVTAIAFLAGGSNFVAKVRLNDKQVAHSFRLGEPEDAPALRALAGHAAWQHAQSGTREALALRYGLVTDETSAVLVKLHDEDAKNEGLPTVVPVAHMLPEGMVAACASRYIADGRACGYLDTPVFLRRDPGDTQVADRRKRRSRRNRKARSTSVEMVTPPGMLDALTQALVRLLLDKEANEVTIDAVLALLDEAWRKPAAAYLAYQCPAGVDRRSAAVLLGALLSQIAGVDLSDDQEARLACIGRTCQMVGASIVGCP